MRTQYAESFLLYDPEFPEMPALQMLREAPGVVQLELRTVWLSPIASVRFELQVPIAEPCRFDWDRNVFGHKVAFPRGAERFCVPRLSSPIAEQIAAAPGFQRRELFAQVQGWQFHWESFFDRVYRSIWSAYHEKLKTTRQRITVPLVRAHFQRAISQLMNGARRSTPTPSGWAENGGAQKLGLPLTDEALLLRQAFEVEANYPDTPGDDWLFENMKMVFLRHLDPGVDLTFTSKNDVGRLVMRVKPEDPVSQVTARPMSRLSLMFNPLNGIASPKRVQRENRSSCLALRLVNPIEPPLKSPAVPKIPEPFQQRITTLNVGFFDIDGLNAWIADEETAALFPNTKVGERLSLDGLMITRTGREKLLAYASRNEIIEEDEYLERREGWSQLAGFREQAIPNIAEVMGDGTLVYTQDWRVWWDEPIPAAYGKFKLTVGGIKGVGRPIQQLFCRVNGKIEPIDLVVSAQTVLSKGAVDAILYALAVRAGLTEIDPTWTRAEIGTRVTAGLQKNGHPADGCFEIIRKQKVDTYGDTVLKPEDAVLFKGIGVTLGSRFEKVVLGRAIVGPCPVVVAPEHEFRQSNAGKGVAVTLHSRLIQTLPFRHDEQLEAQVTKLGHFWQQTAGQ